LSGVRSDHCWQHVAGVTKYCELLSIGNIKHDPANCGFTVG